MNKKRKPKYWEFRFSHEPTGEIAKVGATSIAKNFARVRAREEAVILLSNLYPQTFIRIADVQEVH